LEVKQEQTKTGNRITVIKNNLQPIKIEFRRKEVNRIEIKKQAILKHGVELNEMRK
jgi:hypothetical protein